MDLMQHADKMLDTIVGINGPEALNAYRQKRAEEDARRTELVNQVRRHAMTAAKRCLDVLDYPQSSSQDIAEAIASLLKAREAAQELDPPSAA